MPPFGVFYRGSSFPGRIGSFECPDDAKDSHDVAEGIGAALAE